MTKRNTILQAAVAAALFTAYGAAHAGAITTPASDAAATKYAAEGLTAATAVATPNVVYTMGVARTTAQDFTMIFTPSAGATLTPANCLGTNFTVGGAGAATISTKRASASECAVEVDVTTAFDTTTTITTAGVGQALLLATHPLATAGNSVAYTVVLKDLGETAFIDNSGPLTRTVATSVNAINVYAAAADTATVADVNGAAGPLKNFLANATVPADTATIAQANLTFDNNFVAAKNADGVTNYDFTTTGGTVTVVLTDANKSFGALAANKLCIDSDNDGTLCENPGASGSEILAVAGTTGTSALIPSSAFPAVTTIATRAVSFQANTTDGLGTTRTIAVGGTVTPGAGVGVAIGAAHSFLNTGGVNATWWQWSANAIELWSPYFTTVSGWLSRFAFQNTGIAVGYSTTCLAETGNVVTAGPAATGTLAPGMTVINASDICSFSTNARGNVRFIINAPAGNIHAAYWLVNATSGSVTINEMTRPFAAATY